MITLVATSKSLLQSMQQSPQANKCCACSSGPGDVEAGWEGADARCFFHSSASRMSNVHNPSSACQSSSGGDTYLQFFINLPLNILFKCRKFGRLGLLSLHAVMCHPNSGNCQRGSFTGVARPMLDPSLLQASHRARKAALNWQKVRRLLKCRHGSGNGTTAAPLVHQVQSGLSSFSELGCCSYSTAFVNPWGLNRDKGRKWLQKKTALDVASSQLCCQMSELSEVLLEEQPFE